MAGYVDFAALKPRVSIEQTATLLGLNAQPAGQQLRSSCPKCLEGGKRAIVITPEEGSFYCFPGKKGGDAIELVCHVKGLSQKDAAGNVVSLFADITSQNLETLAALCDQKRCDTIELF